MNARQSGPRSHPIARPMDPKTVRLGRARKPVLKSSPPIFFASVRHAPRYRGPCTPKRNLSGTSLSEVGRAPPRLITHFDVLKVKCQAKLAAITPDSAANGPEDVATGPRAQARPEMFAPDIFLQACDMRPLSKRVAPRSAGLAARACRKLVAHRRALKNTSAP